MIEANKSLLLCALLFISNIGHQCHSHTTQHGGNCISESGGGNQVSEKLYHGTSGQCYDFATRGPCGENMIFYKHPFNPTFGFCDCDQGVRSQFPCSDYPVRKMTYFPRMGKCFPIFSQGPCKEGFWLNYYDSRSTKLTCQRNPCIQTQKRKDPNFDWRASGSRFWFYDATRKACFVSQTKGYCQDGLTLELTHDSQFPQCKQQICYGKLTNFRSDLSCTPGSRYSYLWRGCVRTTRRRFYGIG